MKSSTITPEKTYFNSCVSMISLVMMLGSASATAGPVEDSIKKTVTNGSGGEIVEQVKKAEFGDLYEIITHKGIVYTDKTASFLIVGGTVIDPKNNSNLTAKREREINSARYASFPLADAIKVVHGKGTRSIVTFEDPNCGYCKKLAKELEKVKDVTVYTFLLPILSADSTDKAKTIWCSPDRNKAWHDWMILGSLGKSSSSTCEPPFYRNLALAKQKGIRGTPAIFFPTGAVYPGAITLDTIESELIKK